MPIYEYSCKSCGYEFEDLMSLDANNPQCPKCNSETKRILSGFSSVIKGSNHRSLDCVIGEDSEKKWKKIYERREKRLKKQKESKV